MACWSLLFAALAIAATKAQDPNDLTFFKKGAAVGDSYAAGIGAGNQLDWGCSRYHGSYANLVALAVGAEPGSLEFEYLACSGAVVRDVNVQAAALTPGQEFIILSAGGNDADLVGILNACVFSFWPKLSGCDAKLSQSYDSIQSGTFALALDALLRNVKSKLASNGIV